MVLQQRLWPQAGCKQCCKQMCLACTSTRTQVCCPKNAVKHAGAGRQAALTVGGVSECDMNTMELDSLRGAASTLDRPQALPLLPAAGPAERGRSGRPVLTGWLWPALCLRRSSVQKRLASGSVGSVCANL